MVLAKKVSRCTIDPEMDQASCLSPKVRKSVVCPPVVIVLYQCELSRKAVAVVLVHEGHLLCFTEKRCDCPHGSFAWVLRPVFGRDRRILKLVRLPPAVVCAAICNLFLVCSLGSELPFSIQILESVGPEFGSGPVLFLSETQWFSLLTPVVRKAGNLQRVLFKMYS